MGTQHSTDVIKTYNLDTKHFSTLWKLTRHQSNVISTHLLIISVNKNSICNK